MIRPLSAPLATHPGIVVMRGTLAPDGAVLKRTVADDAPLSFRGPAKVVHSRDEGVAAAKAGRFTAGDVVVLTGLGLRGSPGMGLTSALMFAIDGAGLSASVAVITDGQMSGLVNGGLVVAEVSPEGAAGGPLGLVRDGDMISIDVDARDPRPGGPRGGTRRAPRGTAAAARAGRLRLAVGLRANRRAARRGGDPGHEKPLNS